MANLYVRSSDGSDADNGSTWALAKASVAGAAVIDAAGDVIYVSQAHAESNAAAQSWTFAGTAASPVKLICGNDTAEPPTAVATTATCTTTGDNAITVSGCLYAYGLTLGCGTGAVNASITLNLTTLDGVQRYESCNFHLNGTGSSARISTSSIANDTATGLTEWHNCSVKFGANGQSLQIGRGVFRWRGGSIVSGSSAITNLVQGGSDSYQQNVVIDGVDLSNAATALTLFAGGRAGNYVARNCKLPASWSGEPCGTASIAHRSEMWNCSAGDQNYKLWIKSGLGSVKDETTIKRTGGASDGTTGFCWQMVSGANAEYPHLALTSPELHCWQETVGGSVTATVEIVTDNVTLTDAECWLEVQYLGTSGFPLSSFVTDAKADVLASASNQTTSTETWTTTGLTAPVKQKLAVTFTPQEKGMLIARVHLARASTTVYVDPVLTVV